MTKTPAWRLYPHVVLLGRSRNRHMDVHVTNEELPRDLWHAAYAFWCPGALDTAGSVTPTGRAHIVAELRERCHPTSERCVVWGPRDCTFVSKHAAVDCDEPPFADPTGGDGSARMAPMMLSGDYMELPEGCDASHVFLRRLSFDVVQVSSARPQALATWNEPVYEGEEDPLASCRRPDGGIDPPRFFKGCEVTGADLLDLLGPVQPDGRASKVVRPWPILIRKACVGIAGRPLDARLTLAAWRAVMRQDCAPPRCGEIRRIG